MLLIQIWNRLPIGRDQSDALPRALVDAARQALPAQPQTLLDLHAPATNDVVVCNGGDGAESSVDLAAPMILIAECIGGVQPDRAQRTALARALGEAAKSTLGSARSVHVLVREARPSLDAHWSG
ncbi:MAG: hypothetical protein Q7R80_03500 [bacterium]|nr:hypothetical protein [bacterium]